MRNKRQKGFKNADERKALRIKTRTRISNPIVEITIDEVSPAMKKAIIESEKPKRKRRTSKKKGILNKAKRLLKK